MQTTDALSRARLTLKWFPRRTLVGDLAADLEKALAEVARLEARAIQAEKESAAARAEGVRLRKLQPARKSIFARLIGKAA